MADTPSYGLTYICITGQLKSSELLRFLQPTGHTYLSFNLKLPVEKPRRSKTLCAAVELNKWECSSAGQEVWGSLSGVGGEPPGWDRLRAGFHIKVFANRVPASAPLAAVACVLWARLGYSMPVGMCF